MYRVEVFPSSLWNSETGTDCHHPGIAHAQMATKITLQGHNKQRHFH